jgi:hypothetical protein
LYEAGDPARAYATSWKALVRLQPMLEPTYFLRLKLNPAEWRDDHVSHYKLSALPKMMSSDDTRIPLLMRPSEDARDWRGNYLYGGGALGPEGWHWNPIGNFISQRSVWSGLDIPVAVRPEDVSKYLDPESLDLFLGFI